MKKSKAFTLAEVLITIVIIGIVAIVFRTLLKLVFEMFNRYVWLRV